jgi:hypothetical protein
MKRRAAAAVFAVLFLWSSPALGRDILPEDGRSEPPPPEPEPYPDPAPLIAPPPGIYYVTDTYVADVVTSSGPLTTYSTSTIHESTGSYARVLDTVGTGASSAFDGSAFNGRRALSDGRWVAGTYYENYVLTGGEFVPVSIVFFQDDAELARLLGATPPPPAIAAPAPITPSTPSTPQETTPPLPPECCAGEERPIATIGSPRPAAAKPIRPVISLLPVGAPLAALEVLRGRAVSLWPRAFVDDREVPVRSWTVIAGNAGEALATAGSGGEPFRTSWRRLAPPRAAYEVVFRIEVDTRDTGRRAVDAAIAVVVRSPALVD